MIDILVCANDSSARIVKETGRFVGQLTVNNYKKWTSILNMLFI